MQRVALAAYIELTNRYRQIREHGSERGLTTTEIAVLTFMLVTVAGTVGVLLYQYAQGQVEALPEDPAAEIRDN